MAQLYDADTEGRLRRIETQLYAWKMVGLLVLVAVAALGVLGQTSQPRVARVIEANKFIVRDASGTVRIEIGATPDKGASIDMADSAGKRTFYVGSDGKIFLLQAMNDGAAWVVSLGPEPLGNRVSLSLDNSLRMTLGEDDRNGAGLSLWDRDKRVRARYLVGPDGTSGLFFYDLTGTARLALDTLDQATRLRFMDEKSNVTLGLISTRGQGGISVRDAVATSETLISPLGLTVREKGAVRWRAP